MFRRKKHRATLTPMSLDGVGAVNGTGSGGSARAVARTVFVYGPLSRSEVARRLGLSPASLTRLARPLIEQGLLVEDGAIADPGHGRIMRPLDIAPDLRFIGVKITVATVHGVLTDARANVLTLVDAPLDDTTPDSVLTAIVAVVGELAAAADGARVHSIGVSLGGHTDDNATVVVSRSLGWRDVPLGSRVAERTGLPVVVENDVTAITVAQHLFSAARDSERFALVTVGVGVGCGLVINGDVVRQLDPASPSPSMLVLNPSGPTVPEGPRGSALAYLSSANIAMAASAATGRLLTFEQTIAAARADDPAVLGVVRESASYLGRFIASIATINYVTEFLLSGEGVEIAEIGEDAMLAAVAESRPAWGAPLHIDITPTVMADWARGAAAIAIRSLI